MTTPRRQKSKLVLIEWLDHSAYSTGMWRDQEEVAAELRPAIIKSVGWILHETDTFLTIMSTRDDTPNQVCKHELCILKPTIVKRHALKDPYK